MFQIHVAILAKPHTKGTSGWSLRLNFVFSCVSIELQVEAQAAIIHDVSNLCDVAEAMCSAQEEQLKQSFIDLPVWSSPRELMASCLASLCDE